MDDLLEPIGDDVHMSCGNPGLLGSYIAGLALIGVLLILVIILVAATCCLARRVRRLRKASSCQESK